MCNIQVFIKLSICSDPSLLNKEKPTVQCVPYICPPPQFLNHKDESVASLATEPGSLVQAVETYASSSGGSPLLWPKWQLLNWDGLSTCLSIVVNHGHICQNKTYFFKYEKHLDVSPTHSLAQLHSFWKYCSTSTPQQPPGKFLFSFKEKCFIRQKH